MGLDSRVANRGHRRVAADDTLELDLHWLATREWGPKIVDSPVDGERSPARHRPILPACRVNKQPILHLVIGQLGHDSLGNHGRGLRETLHPVCEIIEVRKRVALALV